MKQEGSMLGDFMVRESASVDGYIALSVRGQKGVLHYLIREKFGHFYLGEEPTHQSQKNVYPTIQALITECKPQYRLGRAMIVRGFEGDTCPNCGATVNSEMEFCEECGTRLRSTKEQIDIYDDENAGGGDTYDGDAGGAGDTYDDSYTGEAGGVYDDSGAGAAMPPQGMQQGAMMGQPQGGMGYAQQQQQQGMPQQMGQPMGSPMMMGGQPGQAGQQPMHQQQQMYPQQGMQQPQGEYDDGMGYTQSGQGGQTGQSGFTGY